MKRIFSERNFAAILFVLVLVSFSFAHEDSKKKDPLYQAIRYEERYPSNRENTADRGIPQIPLIKNHQIAR